MAGFVDLHAHFLPALDDGAKDIETGAAMVRGLIALGFSHLHATPHQRARVFLPDNLQIQAAFAAIRAAVTGSDTGISIGLGAENYWDDVFLERLGEGGLTTYNQGPAFLFELNPREMPPRIEDALFRIRLQGRLPVMAHPERYQAIQDDPTRAETLGQSSALVVDLAALEGSHGRAEQKTARHLVQEGLAHAVASDVHSIEDLRAVAGGIAWIRKRLGPEAVDRLLCDNPRRILASDLP